MEEGLQKRVIHYYFSMSYILKNKNLEIRIDSPLENYNFSRFDWTGKIVEVRFQNILLSSVERIDTQNENHFGKGFYNEFGIDSALEFEETEIGDWFHKIGVGLLKKENNQYLFNKPYQIRPAKFNTSSEPNKITIECKTETINGFSYLLKKEIELHESSFIINYWLENTGDKEIDTHEYAHNFTAINRSIGEDYILNFPFDLKPNLFGETVNPEGKVEIGQNEIKFNGSPKEQFFFSNLTGGKTVDATWELLNLNRKIGIRETGDFQCNKVNLWGWKHVISPELFIEVNVKPGESKEWSRIYEMRKLN